MAQKFYEKATVQATFVNVLPALLVSIAGIWVQINLANEQVALVKQTSKEQETKDSIAAIRATKRYRTDSLLAAKNLELNSLSATRAANSYRNDSLLASKDLELNKLQFELAQLKRKDDIALNTRLESISKNQLLISENQYAIQKKGTEAQAIKDLLRFNLAVTELGNLLPDYGLTIIDFKGRDSWVKKVVIILESQLENPILQEDKTLFEEWTRGIGIMNLNYWIYNLNPNFKSVSADSLKRWIVHNPDHLESFKAAENLVIKLFNNSTEFYNRQTYKRMGIPYFKVIDEGPVEEKH